jgi:proline iminopeptidase
MVAADDGVRLRTWTTGNPSDRPPVILLHGGPGMWDYLEPVAWMLEPLTIVHRFDQRGCGGSDPSDQHTVARYLADIEILRQHWHHDAWIVIGQSFGATLALAYAFAHPERTIAMGYLNGVGVGDWRGPYRRERARRMTSEQQRQLTELETMRTRSRDQEIQFRALSWFTDHADPVQGWRQALADAGTDSHINFLANRMLVAETDQWSATEILAQAQRLPMPCWFVHGQLDPRPIEPVAALAAMIPRSQTHIIEAAGHQPWHEQPDTLQELLGRLVTSTTRQPHRGRRAG